MVGKWIDHSSIFVIIFMLFLLLLCILILPTNLIKYVCVVYVQLLILPAVFPQQSCSKFLLFLKTFIYYLSFRNKQFSGFNMKDYMNYVRPFVHYHNHSKLLQ